MADASGSAFNARQLKVDDVNQAYDLLVQHFTFRPDLLPSSATAEAHAVTMLGMKLKAAGYGLADNTDTLVRNYVAKRARDGIAAASAATARPLAKDLFHLVSGADLPPVQAPQAPATPAATSPAPVTSTPDSTANTAPNTTQKATPVQPAGAHNLAAPAARTENNIEEKDATVMTTEIQTAQTPANSFSDIVIPDMMATAIDTTLQQVTVGKAKSIKDLLASLGEVEATVVAQSQAIAFGEAKLAAYKAGDIDDAEAIDFDKIPTFRPTGFAGLAVSGPMAGVLDTLLQNATGGQISSINQIIQAIAGAEQAAAEYAAKLRGLIRDVKLAAPKKTISVSAGSQGDDEPAMQCDIVMRKASEIFTDAFGHSSPILDFEVPTLEWIEENPDVPVIDPSFRFYAPVLADALDCIVNGEIPWIYGESGCGKSEFFAQIAARLRFPLIRLNMDSHLTRADLVGTNRLIAGENGQPVMKFIKGLVPRALSVPAILLIDEMDLGDPEIMPVLQPVLEGNGMRLLEDGGKYVRPHEWSRIVVTANTIGLGSTNQMYVNAHEQSAATRDRIARYIEMPYLPADKELEVVMARVPDADQEFARKVIQLAGKVREGYRLNEIHQVFSTRTVLRAIRRHAKFAPLYGDDLQATHSTLEVTVLNRCDDTSRAVVKGLIDNIFV